MPSLDHTLLVPTYQRPAMLRTLLAYVAETQPALRVIVLDSSLAAARSVNQTTLRAHSQFQYCDFDPAIPFAQKLNLGMREVSTTFVSLGADDDLAFPAAIGKCVEHLQSRLPAAAAHGIYLGFQADEAPPHALKVRCAYRGPSYDAVKPGDRLEQLLGNYEALYYAVSRTRLAREIFAIQAGIESLLFQELFQAAATVLTGPAIRLPEVYCARRLEQSAGTHRRRWHPARWIQEEGPEDFRRQYLAYREQLCAWWKKCEPDLAPELRIQLCDAYHYLYLCNELPAASARGLAQSALGFDVNAALANFDSQLAARLREPPSPQKMTKHNLLAEWIAHFRHQSQARWTFPGEDQPVVFHRSLPGARQDPEIAAAVKVLRSYLLRERQNVRDLALADRPQPPNPTAPARQSTLAAPKLGKSPPAGV